MMGMTRIKGDIYIGNTQYAQHSGPELAVAIVLSKTTITKIPLVKKLAWELMKHTKYINWNYKGILTHPSKFKGTRHINLARMLDIMITKTEKATPTEMGIILNVIKPIYPYLKPHVRNINIRKQFDQWDVAPAAVRNRKQSNAPITYQTL